MACRRQEHMRMILADAAPFCSASAAVVCAVGGADLEGDPLADLLHEHMQLRDRIDLRGARELGNVDDLGARPRRLGLPQKDRLRHRAGKPAHHARRIAGLDHAMRHDRDFVDPPAAT